MNIEIISAVAADAEALVTIQKKAFKRLYDIYHDEGSPYLRGADEIIRWLERPNWSVYKIIADGVLCGGVSFCEMPNKPGEYYLARIYISPEMQSKGIASTAILLCEAKTINATRWTLDFPAEQAANQRCYEKAGYTLTGEKREQSSGAITLAYMEKRLPAFRDIRAIITSLEVNTILSAAVFDNSPEGMKKVIENYINSPKRYMYGWIDEGRLLGVVGFEVHENRLEICYIATAEDVRHRGIGSGMIRELRPRYALPIEAETDDDAVEFYRKCGFEAAAIRKYDVRRWICTLPALIDEERQAILYPIILSEYNPAWPDWYTEEKAKLERLIGAENIVRISHIGSTAVPGLAAKPTVDILLEIHESADVEGLIAALPGSEYICLREQTINSPDRIMFLKGYTDTGFAEKVFHIHVRDFGNWDELHFRDYLIAHPEAATEYGELKHKLFKGFKHDRDGYTVAKGVFIQNIVKKAKEERK